VMSNVARAARAPPMNTLDEPVMISNSGGRPQQVGFMPRSPQRAAGLPLISTDLQVPSITGPSGGNGVGGAGGGTAGNGGTRGWGRRSAGEKMVAAGNGGKSAERALVAPASAPSRNSAALPARAAAGLATICAQLATVPASAARSASPLSISSMGSGGAA